MNWFLDIGLMFILTVIFVQDWKERAVYWWLFPILLAVSVWQFVQNNLTIQDLLTSVIFLCMVMVSLIGYMAIRRGKLVNIFKSDFGWGDVLFLLAVMPLFTHQAYILFFISGMFLSLLFHLIVMRGKKVTIPLAGYLSIYVIFIQGLTWFGFNINHQQLF